MNEVAFFGVRLSYVSSAQELRKRFLEFLNGDAAHVVVTPNPEILVRARNDARFAHYLNAADFVLPDGFGTVLFARMSGKSLRRWPGIDAAMLLLEEAQVRNFRVVLLGGFDGIAARAAQSFAERLPGLHLSAIGDGVSFGNDGAAVGGDEEAVLAAIRTFGPHIILVGLGAPKQEAWIVRHRARFPSVRVMMAVGGAFDVWGGRVRRAPYIFRMLGMEWAWRLMREPRRFSRIFRATVLFPWYVLRERTPPVKAGIGER
ncbi:MAG: WecB/TagA/CpsF family glycosyltransferase [Candidatus Terrybacteria bacterium]|nr:WecB/TagA/CpsF family glycosyltransferase [Candidatus Terrybacteria bacterium]